MDDENMISTPQNIVSKCLPHYKKKIVKIGGGV